jgi:cytochrome P450
MVCNKRTSAIQSSLKVFNKSHIRSGPIIRVTPREIHIKDSDYYDEIYSGPTRKREKDGPAVRQFDLNGSAFAAISSELHRERRAPMNPFFSKQAISQIETDIKKRLDQFYQHLSRAHQTGRIISLDAGFSALTSDVVLKYAFGFDGGNLEQEDFNEHIRDGIIHLFTSAHIAYFFPFLPAIMGSLPISWVKAINPFAAVLALQKDDLRQRVRKFLSGYRSDNGCVVEKLCSPDMPAHMLDVERLTDEGHAMAIAGTETTARSLSVGSFHIYSNERIKTKLREELRAVMPTPESCPSWNELEKLPYLSGTVYESLRCSTGISARSPRIAPTETLVYNDYQIPPGVSLISQKITCAVWY